jgi:hypothetical protein
MVDVNVFVGLRLIGLAGSIQGPIPENTCGTGWHLLICFGFLISAGSFARSAHWQPPESKLSSVSRADLCITEGAISEFPDHRLLVTAVKMCAYVNVVTGQRVEARFKYLGSTAEEVPLGSGEIRRQFGLKLRAEDACNLVYAMWRIEPESKLVVSVKSNPGQHSSAECGNRGYQNIKPRSSKPVPRLVAGQMHTLRAEINSEQMRVFADDTPVWEGSLGAQTRALEGPVGIRSDNARLEIALRAELPPGQSVRPGCRTGQEVE